MNNSNAKYYFLNNRKFWISAPFVKFLVPYCTGIISYKSLTINFPIPFSILIFGLFFLLIYQINKNTYAFKNQSFIAGIYIYISLLILGNLCASINDQAIVQKKFLENYSQFSCFTGVISKTSESGPFQKCIIAIQEGRSNTPSATWKKTIGRIAVLYKGENEYKTGDKIIIKNELQEIRGPETAFDVDFKKIYANQGIFLQQFITDENKMHSYGVHQHSIKRIAVEVNTFLKETLKGTLSPQSYAIASALLLGDKSDLDERTKTTFSQGGIMHILAVSGLHVGILFLIISNLLGFLKTFRCGKVYFFVVALVILWGFAFITGLTNSVVRAALMFSIFSAGPLIGKRTFGINITAVSAFVILLLNPYALFEVSFQLSYAAVFSILFFYNDIYQLLKLKKGVLDSVWQISCVSIAAQLGTFPLVAMYFQHFQPLFLLFNLVAIPFAFVVLTGGIIYLSTYFIPFVTDIISVVLDKTIEWGVSLFEYILSFAPEFNIRSVDLPQVVLFYLLIFTVSAFLAKKKLTFLAISVVVMGLLNSTIIDQRLHTLKQHELLISSSKNNFIIDIIEGDRFFSLSNLKEDDQSLSIESQRKRQLLGSNHPITPQHVKSEAFDLVVVGGKSYLLIREDIFLPPDLHVDYLFVDIYTDVFQESYYSKFADNIISLKSY